ncbi:unnamed protein product [Echinostoma caproni]|uniref:Anaphase-promoting complex subunit 2 n=1 Tax=Echinostoma caproni TaxID=27848 RepID=A0A183ARA6_9TREM|nr:unnamed protein product [Echinostoma caproni]
MWACERMNAHEAISAVFGFDASTTPKDTCKQLFLEYLTFHLQSSGAANLFTDFLNQFEHELSNTCSSKQLSVTNEETKLFDRFLTLLIEFNTHVNQFLTSTFKCPTMQFEPSQIPKSLWREIQTCLACVVLPADLCARLHALLEVYLRLELELAETQDGCFHVFSAILPGACDTFKQQTVQCARIQSQANQPLMLTRFFTPLCLPFARSALTIRVSTLCTDNFSEHFLEAILDYKEKVLKGLWLRSVFEHCEKQVTLISPQLSDSLVYEVFYEVRKSDLFSLIIEYPDSIAALLDLGKCVDHISVRRDLIAHLTEEVKQRLLHPGVHTEQILVAYSYLVRALRLVDKSYLTQDIVCRPVSLCLRQREDAVRCIVDKLISAPESGKDEIEAETDEPVGSTTELHSELLLPKPLEVEPVDGAEDSDADVVAEDPPFDADCHVTNDDVPDTPKSEPDATVWGANWQPDPVEAMYQGGLWRRRMDLLSMLVSIYGSKKAFLVEYKQLLSQRLLKQRSFHTARELRNLELLKLRFGEQNLVECEVSVEQV